MAVVINSNGHLIEIQASGVETVKYDGYQVSSKMSIFGATHLFSVQEDGVLVHYEVKISTRWWGGIKIEVRRNGIIIYSG